MLIHRSLAALKEFIGRVDMKVRDVGTGWVWYRLPTFFDGALSIGIELGFNQGNLEKITLFHDDPAIYGKDWNDWSEKKEHPNMALNLAPFGRWTRQSCALASRLALRSAPYGGSIEP